MWQVVASNVRRICDWFAQQKRETERERERETETALGIWV